MMGFTIERLSDELRFGKRVTGLVAGHLTDPAVRDELRRLWIEDGLVLFRDGDTSEAFHVALSRVFGSLDHHPVKEVANADNPELITVSSVAGEGTIHEVDGVQGGAFLSWHSDLIYHERINHGGILRAVRITSSGGITGFLDQIDAYERLPERMKARVEGLGVIYQLCQVDASRYATRSKVRILRVAEFTKRIMARVKDDFPPVVHPLVFVQQETGRKVLNYSPYFAHGIEGMSAAEGDVLLRELSDHMFDSPAYHHRWRVDDLLLWDNWRMLHCVSPAPIDETRIMQRTTIAGDYALGRKLRIAA